MTTLPEEAVKAASHAVILGEDEKGNPVHLSNEEARTALTAALPFLPVQGASSARELALEEAANRFDRLADIINRNLYHQQEKIKDAQYIAAEGSAAIRTLFSPAHADAGKVEGDGWLPMTHPSLPKKGRFLAVATGEIERIAWNDPAAVVTVKAFDGPFVCYVHEDGAGFTDEFGEVYRADGVVIDAEDLTAADDVLRLTRWRPLPSAPASEGAE